MQYLQFRALCVVALVVAYCSGCAAVATSQGATVAGNATADVELSEERESPLDVSLYGSFGGYQEIWLATENWVQDSIRACMAEKGFDYIRQDPDELQNGLHHPTPERDGWNIVTSVRTSLSDADETPNQPPVEMPEGLTAAQSSKWNAAMYGDDQGCAHRATDGAFDIEGFVSRSEWLEQGLAQVHEHAASDPRVDQANADAEQCLNDQGLNTEQVALIQTQLRAEMEPVYEFLATTPEQPSWADIPVALREIMDRVQSEETLYATIFETCEAPSNDVYDQVYREYQAEWVQENELRLAELADQIDDEIQKHLSKYIDN